MQGTVAGSEILHHLGCKNPVNNGIPTSTGEFAGVLNHQQHHLQLDFICTIRDRLMGMKTPIMILINQRNEVCHSTKTLHRCKSLKFRNVGTQNHPKNHHFWKYNIFGAWKSSANLPFGNPLGCHEPTNNYHWRLGSPWQWQNAEFPRCQKVVERATYNQREDWFYS